MFLVKKLLWNLGASITVPACDHMVQLGRCKGSRGCCVKWLSWAWVEEEGRVHAFTELLVHSSVLEIVTVATLTGNWSLLSLQVWSVSLWNRFRKTCAKWAHCLEYKHRVPALTRLTTEMPIASRFLTPHDLEAFQQTWESLLAAHSCALYYCTSVVGIRLLTYAWYIRSLILIHDGPFYKTEATVTNGCQIHSCSSCSPWRIQVSNMWYFGEAFTSV